MLDLVVDLQIEADEAKHKWPVMDLHSFFLLFLGMKKLIDFIPKFCYMSTNC